MLSTIIYILVAILVICVLLYLIRMFLGGPRGPRY